MIQSQKFGAPSKNKTFFHSCGQWHWLALYQATFRQSITAAAAASVTPGKIIELTHWFLFFIVLFRFYLSFQLDIPNLILNYILTVDVFAYRGYSRYLFLECRLQDDSIFFS